MGTNYYLNKHTCKTCGRGEQLHIGKSSAGWHFSLHIYPDDNITTLEDWKPLLKDGTIKDEYGETIATEEMLDIITKRKRDKWETTPFGYKSWEEFHYKNDSARGFKNLLRHKVDGRHCTGNGDGTYDYMIGEFS